MEDFQKRVIDEWDQLSQRVDKLSAFFGSPVSDGVPDDELGRLELQLHLMQAYLHVLNERIRNF